MHRKGKRMEYVVIAFVVGLLIAIHEYGHLLAAKLCRIPVERFSIGFGPKLFGFKVAETSYWLSWVPIGGYVLPALDDTELRQLPTYKRVTFALGGPAANIVAAFVGLFAIGILQFGLALVPAVLFASTRLLTGLQQQVLGLSMLFSDFGQVSGIVGIVAIGGENFGATLASLLTFSVLMNISLAVLNLIPLPPLDGSKVLFAVLQKIYRPTARIEVPVTLAGWALLMVLMVGLTVRDVGRILA